MTDPRDLLGRHGAPTPLARPMPTEIRSDGGLRMELLQAPVWAGPEGNPVIAEWRFAVSLDQLLELRTFLVKPDPETGIQPEAAIDAALRATGIGAYLGTFAAEGPNLSDVRILFAFRPRELITEAELNRKLFALLGDVGGRYPQASRDLRYLRTMFNASPVRSDVRLLMLSQVDLLGTLTDPGRSPFSADLLTRDHRTGG